ncbi:MAG: lysine--tRNA ligase [Candidatus Shapirobacteria bacterium]
MAQPIEELRKIRLGKLAQIRKLGIDPYPAKARRDQSIAQALKMLGKKVAVAGRIRAMRGHGGIQFWDLQDASGKIQLVFKSDKLSTIDSRLSTFLDIGDFIAVQGKVFQTEAGQISVLVEDFQLLTKSLRPLPSSWYGLKDEEIRYRKRYLDLIVNPESKKIFDVRSVLVQSMRRYLLDRGYFEIETPVLQPLYGGGLAQPFKTYHNVLGIPLYLRVSTELYLKRLIVGGYEKVFEIAKLFRNEGIDKNHNPEFTLLETMEAYIDYRENMELVEQMTELAVIDAVGTTMVNNEGNEIDFKPPWKRLTMVESVKEFTGVDFNQIKNLSDALKVANKLGVELDKHLSSAKGLILAAIFENKVEKNLIQPTIVYDFPVETSPLAKRCVDNPDYVERWEHFVVGVEASNNYSELNDPLDLAQRFKDERKKERLGDEEAHQTDEDFIEAMEYGMPLTSGIGPGIDRLALVVCNQFGAKNLRDVILFPTMRSEGLAASDGVFGDKVATSALFEIKVVEPKIPKVLGITRERVLELLKRYLKEEKELNHLFASEIAMDYYAKKFGGNADAWRLAGLLHDLDWDFVDGNMEKHGKTSADILRREGVCEPIIYSILAHVGFSEFPRKSKMDSALWGSEELTGLILALVKGRPDKNIKNVTKETVLRAYRNHNFASGVNRTVIKQGAEELGLSLDEHMGNVLEAMKSIEYSL